MVKTRLINEYQLDYNGPSPKQSSLKPGLNPNYDPHRVSHSRNNCKHVNLLNILIKVKYMKLEPNLAWQQCWSRPCAYLAFVSSHDSEAGRPEKFNHFFSF